PVAPAWLLRGGLTPTGVCDHDRQALHERHPQPDHAHVTYERAVLAVDAPAQLACVSCTDDAFKECCLLHRASDVAHQLCDAAVAHRNWHVGEQVLGGELCSAAHRLARAHQGIEPFRGD